MPATIIRRSPTGRTLINANVNVANDGLVTVAASYLLNSPAELGALSVDAPVSDPFQGLPNLQGGLFVLNRSTNKRGGLLYCDVELVGALNPPRYVVFDGKEVRSFTGTLPDSITSLVNVGVGLQPYRTDYYAPYRTITWTNMAGQVVRPGNGNPVESIERFNTRQGFLLYEVQDGEDNVKVEKLLIGERAKEIFVVQLSQQEVGRVVRSTLTTTKILEPQE
jgi:hypothetical protein